MILPNLAPPRGGLRSALDIPIVVRWLYPEAHSARFSAIQAISLDCRSLDRPSGKELGLDFFEETRICGSAVTADRQGCRNRSSAKYFSTDMPHNSR